MSDLTPREQQVCKLLTDGLSNKEIADLLGHISRRTVEDHRRNLFRKYGVKNAVQLTRKVYHLDEQEPA